MNAGENEEERISGTNGWPHYYKGQRGVNDFGNHDGASKSGGYQLCVQFENEAVLQQAYAEMQTGSVTIEPMQPTDYSPCTVRFIDRFDVRWAIWVS